MRKEHQKLSGPDLDSDRLNYSFISQCRGPKSYLESVSKMEALI